MVAQPGRRGSSIGRRGSTIGRRGSSMVAHQAVVLQSRVRIRRLPSPQLIANLLVGCHPGMALGCGLTSVRGNRGKNYENEPPVPQKHKKEKIIINWESADKLLTIILIGQ